MKHAKLIELARWHLIFMGLWNFKKSDPSRRRLYLLYDIYKAFIPAYMILFLISLILNMIQLIANKEEIADIFLSVAFLLSNIDITSKILIFIKNDIPDWLYLVCDMERNLWEYGTEKMKKYYMGQVNLCNIFVTISTAMIIISMSIFIISKLQLLFVSEIAPGKGLFFMWLPFDKTKNTVATWTIEIWLCYFNVLLFVTVKITIITLIIFLYTHLRVLHIRIKNIGDKQTNEEDVITFIKQHQHLISLENRVNDLLKYLLLQEYFLNAANIAASLVQILVLESFLEILYMCLHGLYASFQIFALGWVANEVKEESMGISDAISNCCFYNCTISTQKSLLITMIRAQRPLMLTLGPFGSMSLSTSISVVKAAYSYATLTLNRYNAD
ncbi:hypothetical protein GWI33_020264 [Rhynchophorus ferrugineus]|uniref:Odorant receptor n=1 Tax=Rhynchophorus ferrugineus TaxID=354439 RepID=A0A834HSS7_RHYFE|nr:hypothetical protein GWI33_020264 [Rhynchophorus ferrugineus]